MNKILLSYLIALLLPLVILGGCGKAETGEGEAEETASESASGEDTDDEVENAEGEGLFSKGDAVLGSVAFDKDTGDDEGAEKGGAWRKAYLDYLEENPAEDGGYSYALIYVDDDDIPELVVDTGFEAGGCQIVTYHDGATDVLQTSRLYFTYIEKKNKLNNCDGHMGYYYDIIYSIEDGKWTVIFDGEYSGFEDEENVDYDEETGRYRCTDYLVDGKETDEAGYNKALKKAYDLSAARDVESYVIYDDLISYLNTGRFIFEDHSYELFTGDCSWEEAKRACEKKGGYLACMTCDEEFELVEKLIRQEDKTNFCFYVGGTRGDDYNWHWIEPGLSQNGCLGSGYYKHWLDGGPSYTDTLPDGTEIDEKYAELLYRKADDSFYLNDVTNDVPGIYPSYRGRIGYICEFEE